jgi:hypothetical protein
MGEVERGVLTELSNDTYWEQIPKAVAGRTDDTNLAMRLMVVQFRFTKTYGKYATKYLYVWNMDTATCTSCCQDTVGKKPKTKRAGQSGSTYSSPPQADASRADPKNVETTKAKRIVLTPYSISSSHTISGSEN